MGLTEIDNLLDDLAAGFGPLGEAECGSVDPQISPRRCSSTAGREGRARLKRAFSPKGGSGRANQSLYGLEVQSKEDTKRPYVIPGAKAQRPRRA